MKRRNFMLATLASLPLIGFLFKPAKVTTKPFHIDMVQLVGLDGEPKFLKFGNGRLLEISDTFNLRMREFHEASSVSTFVKGKEHIMKQGPKA